MKKVYFVFLMINIFSFGQKKEGQARIDSLLVLLPKMREDSLKVKMLNEISKTYQLVKPSEGVKYSITALKLLKKINWIDGLPDTYFVLGRNYNSKLDNYNAIFYLNEAIKGYKQNSKKARAIAELSNVYYHQMDTKKSLQLSYEALTIFENINDSDGRAYVLTQLGKTYNAQKLYDKAIIFHQKAIEINKNNESALAVNLSELGVAYEGLEKYKQAEKSYLQAYLYSKKLGASFNEVLNLGSLVNLYFNTKEFDKALIYNNKLINLSNDLYGSNNSYCKDLSGEIYFEKAKIEKNVLVRNSFLEKAVSSFKDGIKLGKDSNDLDGIKYAYIKLSDAQKLVGNYKEALENYEQASLYKDSIFNSENKETIKNLEDKREIELRDREIKINKLSLEANQKQKWFYILGLGFLTILGGLLFFQSRKRKITNQKLQVLNTELDQANKTKTRFFSILNHDLRSPVANLIHFLHLQKDNPELLDEATKTRMQDKTITGAENLLLSMEDILLWSKGQMENFKPQPKQIAINQLFDDTKKVFSGYLKIKFEYHNPENLEVFTDENYLKTIIRNLTSNAINVFTTTENPTIIWKAYQSENKTFLSITDNGPGATQDQFKALYDDTEVVGIKTGLGLHLIRDLAKAIDCEITVDCKIDEGTTFILKLK